MDVSGGKGDLSWLLVNVEQLDSIVTDPRLTKHNSQLRSIKYLRENPKEALIRSIPNRPTLHDELFFSSTLENLGRRCYCECSARVSTK